MAISIVGIDCHVLLIPSADESATDSAQDNLVVFIHTDAGITGVGESDANPWMLKAAIEAPSTHTMGMGLKDMLMGTDPMRDAEAIWEELYTGTAMNGRRGVVIHAMGALDMALWDIKGKVKGVPCWQLLLDPGVTPPAFITPYASLQPSGASLDEYKQSLVTWALQAQSLGFHAAKLEATLTGPYAHQGMNDPRPESVTQIISAVRAAVGADFSLMVDVQYAFEDAGVVADMVTSWQATGLDIYFIETPLRMELVDEMGKLRTLLDERGVTTKIAYGEWQATRYEFEQLAPHIDVLQPDVGRVGGLTEAVRVCRLARALDKIIVPHVWKSGIGIAATAHLAATAPHCRFFEFLPATLTNSPLRQRLTVDDEVMLRPDGTLALPSRPGLGVRVDMAALREFEASAAAAIARGAGHGLGQAALADSSQHAAAQGGGLSKPVGSAAGVPVLMPVLVVGAGVISRFHLTAMKASGRFVCAAVADIVPAAAESLADAAAADGIPRPAVFESLDAALDADRKAGGGLFHAVWVLVPNVARLHVQLATVALEASKHVLLEKPIALTPRDARELLNRAPRTTTATFAAAGQVSCTAPAALMVAENVAFWPAVLAVSDALSRGDIGDVFAVRAKAWESAGGPWGDCYTAGSWQCTNAVGPLFDSASHWLRPLRMWLGEIDAVFATATQPITRMVGPTSMQALLRFKSGHTAVFESVLAPSAIGDQPFFSLQGTKGELVLSGFDGAVHVYTGEPTSPDATYGQKTLLRTSHWDTSYAEELRAFAATIIDGAPLNPMASADEATRDLEVICALMESAKEGGASGWRAVNDL